MKIGVDLSPLQGPHRMRGVGSVIVNLLNNIPDAEKKKHEFVFYVGRDEKTIQSALELINLAGLNYELREKPAAKKVQRLILPGRLNLLTKVASKFMSLLRFSLGANGYDYGDLDFYLHTDQMLIMPRMPGVKKLMIAYDVIPYVLEWDYLWSYKTARRNGLSVKRAMAAQLNRRTYINKLKINGKKAYKVLAISKQTAADFTKLVKVPEKKVRLFYLGINPINNEVKQKIPTEKYVHTSWGYFSKPLDFDNEVLFILFVGGTDARRKLEDLVIAFNHLRAEGHDLKLVLSGDILQGPNNLPVKASREALLSSSYTEDIIYLGFTNEQVKNWLYKHALAFVYPSRYEGFGLPVLEAMNYGTPVITYKNSSIAEVAGDAAIYAHDALSIKDAVAKLLTEPVRAKHCGQLGQKQAAKFSWGETANKFFKELI